MYMWSKQLKLPLISAAVIALVFRLSTKELLWLATMAVHSATQYNSVCLEHRNIGDHSHVK